MSRPYPKINAVWKREPNGTIIPGEFATPEIEYLRGLDWIWTEKVDGTNIRLSWSPEGDYLIEGRTDRAQIPSFLLEGLHDVCRALPWADVFGEQELDGVTLYGEGYGNRIQGVGSQYIPDGTDFVLFDVLVEGPEKDWWLRREDVEDVGNQLGLDVVQEVFRGPIAEAIWKVKHNDFMSAWAGVEHPEGLVGRPVPDLFDRAGKRITTKVKIKDLDDIEAALKGV